MGIYVYNSPTVISHSGGYFYVTIKVDGTQYGGGKEVEWTDIFTNANWLKIDRFDTEYNNEGDPITEVTFSATSHSGVMERTARCYCYYRLPDGTENSSYFEIVQEGKTSISFTISNPKVFSADNNGMASFETVYVGSADGSTIYSPVVNGTFELEEITAGSVGSGYSYEYMLYPLYNNVYGYNNEGTVTFSYLNPNTSVVNERKLYITQEACKYPFGFTYNGEVIPLMSPISKVKRLSGIDFRGGEIIIECNYPFEDGIPDVEFSDNGAIATMTAFSDMFPDEWQGFTERYLIEFYENRIPNARQVELKTRYRTIDGQVYEDRVLLVQDASDGSNAHSITSGTQIIRFKADGTPEMPSYKSVDINWLGEWSEKARFATADWVTIGEPVLTEDKGAYNKVFTYPLTVQENRSNEPRSTYINFQGLTPDGDEEILSIEIIQAKSDRQDVVKPDIPVEGDEYIGQIWKDVEYNFGNNDVVEYSIIKVNGETETPIFFSRTNLRPNMVSNKILVNKICQNYMETPYLNKDYLEITGNYQEFKLASVNGNVVYKTYKFVNDWSYTDDFRTGLLSHPILNDRTVYRGQKLPFSVFAAAENAYIEYGVKYKENAVDYYGKPLEDIIWNGDVTNDLITYNFPNPRAAEYVNEVESFVIGDVEYPVADCGVDYVLYYINPWGGYDWFPIKGKVIEKDSLTQYTYTQNYLNTSYQFGKNRYLSEIHKKYTLNTHWLREDESNRMWYLLESNVVYLHNLKTDEIHPVLITNTDVEYKKRGVVSNRISYQIEVELSQTRERL